MNYSLEAEQAVLGAIMLQPDLLDDYADLQPEEFGADERHQMIMRYLRYTYDQDGTIDLVLMAQRSGKNLAKLGGMPYLTQLCNSVPTVNHFNYYRGIIRTAYLERLSADTLRDIAEAGQVGISDVTSYLNEAQSRIEEIQELAAKQKTGGLKKMGSVLDNHEEVIEERRTKKGLTGARTISSRVDNITGGHQRQELEIVAARPSVGKTAFMNGDALKTARGGTAAAVFSGEMPEKQISERMICAMANIESSKLRSGAFDDTDWLKWSVARDELDQLPIFIDDTPNMTIQHIRSEVARMVKTHPNLVVYIDYLQLIGGGGAKKFKDKREEVEYVSKSLKVMARQFDITVVALAQLSRGVEQRQDKRPMLSDIKEAGGIEQDADIIIFLHRDDYYNQESEKKGIIELIFAKGRNVGTFTVEMAFLKAYGKFADLDHTHQQPKEQGGGSDGKDTGKNRKR